MLGFLNIYKPGGMTSHDVVAKVRRIISVKQVGHAGTLDPMAEGVLPIAVGQACRLLRFLPEGKTYEAEILLGRTTTTDDTEGEIINELEPSSIPPLTAGILRERLQKFAGKISQVPPIYSAVHHQGKRLYALARQGAVNIDSLPAREVVIHSIEVLAYSAPKATVRIDCGSGTYIRAIARDLGQDLGCGGCLSRLLRERSGPFHLSKSVTLPDLERAKQAGEEEELLIAPEDNVLWQNSDVFELRVNSEISARVQHGQKIDTKELPEAVAQAGKRSILLLSDELIAMCRLEQDKLCPEVVIRRRDKND